MDFDKIYNSLTPAERAYFIACTDPFHDKPYDVIGRPSSSTQRQNTTVINLTRTFVASDFGSDGNVWDCNICSLPYFTTQVLQNVDDTGYLITPIGTRPEITGGLTAWGGATGESTVIPSHEGVVHSLNLNNFLYPDWNTSSTNPIRRSFYEVLSAAFEVTNVTPELHLGGSLVRYRVPTQGRKASLAIFDLAQEPPLTIVSPRTEFYAYPMPPSTPAEAAVYPDSVVTKAKEGTYSINTLQDGVSDYYLTGNERIFFEPIKDAGSNTGNALMSASAINKTYDYDPPLVRGDFDMVGAYFYGLPPETVLNVKYKVILSTVPNSSDGQLIALAKNSPDYNAKLLSLISHIQGEFQPGVPVTMNPHGEWFKKVLSIGKRVAPKLVPVAKDLLDGNLGGAAENTIKILQNHATKTNNKTNEHDRELHEVFVMLTDIYKRLGLSAPSNLKQSIWKDVPLISTTNARAVVPRAGRRPRQRRSKIPMA